MSLILLTYLLMGMFTMFPNTEFHIVVRSDTTHWTLVKKLA